MSALQSILSGRIRLPSPPAIAIKILETVSSDDFCFEKLAQVIESDPALSARILKVVNSPSFSMAQKVISINKAVAILGSQSVKNIALSFVIYTEFQKENGGLFDATKFWRRSLTSAVAADLTAMLAKIPNKDIFTIALLQDIGILLLHSSCPRDYDQVLRRYKESEMPISQIEQIYFGFDHQQLGAELLQKWHLPEEIYIPVRQHHFTEAPDERFRTQLDILNIANAVSSFYIRNQDINKIKHVRTKLESLFGIDAEMAETLFDSAASKTLDMFNSFDIAAGAMKPLSLILQEANEELSKVCESYEFLFLELKQAKEKAEKLAEELNVCNEINRELAYRDGMTGIFNHRFFQESMDREFIRSQRYNRDFSLILFDIDNFKMINDEHGHTVGDSVLVTVCNFLEKIVRSTDIVARYGGDEFAVIMPETDLENALIVAEHIRNGIEKLEFKLDDLNIQITISAGVTCNNAPSKRFADKRALINDSDKALYMAKHYGRNQVQTLKIQSD